MISGSHWPDLPNIFHLKSVLSLLSLAYGSTCEFERVLDLHSKKVPIILKACAEGTTAPGAQMRAAPIDRIWAFSSILGRSHF